MDARTSQGAVAGYKAAVLAADTYGEFFPALTTVATADRAARVLVVGAGVAGLHAISTARHLGARVTGYDIRPAAGSDITALGATFLAAPGGDSEDALLGSIADFDVVITAAHMPGRKPPVLVTMDAVRRMRPGSVIVDLCAGPMGGNHGTGRLDRLRA